MSTSKKIGWESWNAKIEEILREEKPQPEEENEEFGMMDTDPEGLLKEYFVPVKQKVVYTPYGPYPAESSLKPSDRWDCWMCYTNFDLTNEIIEVLEDVNGIEALKPLGRYTFFVGIAKMFNTSEVRKEIEDTICNYTVSEVLDDAEIMLAVDLVKEQLDTNRYWSIFVSPQGEIDYIVSDDMNKQYLDELSELEALKQKIGGVILRSTNG